MMKSKFNFGDLDKLNYNDINTFNQKLGEDGFDPKDFFDEFFNKHNERFERMRRELQYQSYSIFKTMGLPKTNRLHRRR